MLCPKYTDEVYKSIEYCKNLPHGFQFITDSQDVEYFNEEYKQDYDSYFVLLQENNGNVIHLFGMEGIVPYNDKRVYFVK